MALHLKMLQKSVTILGHIMIARAFPETIRMLIVVAESDR